MPIVQTCVRDTHPELECQCGICVFSRAMLRPQEGMLSRPGLVEIHQGLTGVELRTSGALVLRSGHVELVIANRDELSLLLRALDTLLDYCHNLSPASVEQA